MFADFEKKIGDFWTFGEIFGHLWTLSDFWIGHFRSVNKYQSDISAIGVKNSYLWFREMLTLADKGGRKGLDLPFLADIICKQPQSKQ